MYQAAFSQQSAVPGGGTTGQQITSHFGSIRLKVTQLCSSDVLMFSLLIAPGSFSIYEES